MRSICGSLAKRHLECPPKCLRFGFGDWNSRKASHRVGSFEWPADSVRVESFLARLATRDNRSKEIANRTVRF